ncbi:MAG: hypothetical protein OWQ57_01315 [Sulfobacillus sp.]|nr:hypothetical protein [Sulfobacillus sp.]
MNPPQEDPRDEEILRLRQRIRQLEQELTRLRTSRRVLLELLTTAFPADPPAAVRPSAPVIVFPSQQHNS